MSTALTVSESSELRVAEQVIFATIVEGRKHAQAMADQVKTAIPHLKSIKKKRLYRPHGTWAEYCHERLGISVRTVDHWIANKGLTVIDNPPPSLPVSASCRKSDEEPQGVTSEATGNFTSSQSPTDDEMPPDTDDEETEFPDFPTDVLTPLLTPAPTPALTAKDQLGHLITDPAIAAVFQDKRLREVKDLVDEARRKLKLLMNSPLVIHMYLDDVDADLNAARNRLNAAAPYAITPPGAGDDKMQRAGWCTREQYNLIPSEMRAEAVA